MAVQELQQTALRLSRSLGRTSEGESLGPLVPALLRLIARGRPATSEEIAAATGASVEDVRQRLRSMPDVETDVEGNLVGMGLTLRPTPHRFSIGGRQLYTWCALDTLMYPPLLDEPATIESPCRATGDIVRVEVGPEGVRGIQPAEAVVSIVIPEECCGTIRTSFCNEVHFFRSREAASGWLEGHPDALIVSVQDGFEIGRRLNGLATATTPRRYLSSTDGPATRP